MKTFTPHDYQRYALNWLIQKTLFEDRQGAAFLLDPGLGKTAITLAWLRLMNLMGLSQKVLVVAPLRVVYSVWPAECQKWEQFKDFKTSIIHGTPTQRMAAISQPADIYLINPEGVAWLQNYYDKREMPFNVLIVDESSKFKTWSSKRTKALKKLLPRFEYRLILTGTPASNGLMDLFAQVFICDLGGSLGTGITKFKNRYFYRGGYGGYQYIPHETSRVNIENKIAPFCLRLSAAEHLDLPDLLINDIAVPLPEEARTEYDRMEKQMFIALENDKELSVANAGVKYLACRQIANGGMYDEDRNAVEIHDAKVEAAADIVDELQGKPVMIAFQFRHDLDRLRKQWKKLPSIDGSTTGKDADTLVQKWNAGELPVLAVQPQSLSHGVNMQSGPGRDIIWFGLTDNLETYAQLNARIHRQGVTGQVRVHRLIANRTVDQAIANRLESKDNTQKALLNALENYRGSQE